MKHLEWNKTYDIFFMLTPQTLKSGARLFASAPVKGSHFRQGEPIPFGAFQSSVSMSQLWGGRDKKPLLPDSMRYFIYTLLHFYQYLLSTYHF